MPNSTSSDSTAIAAPATAEAKEDMSTGQHQIWQSSINGARRGTWMQLLKGLVLITLVLWICLPIFWGSNWLLLRYFNQLTVTVVDFESSGNNAAYVGPVLTRMAEMTNSASMKPHLGFAIQSASDYPGGVDQVKKAIGYSHYWGAIVAYPNCTSTWESSLATGNASYDPTGCIGVFWNTARFYQISLLYVAPFMTMFANMVAQQASRTAIQQYLSTTSAANAATAAAAVPQAFATPFSVFQEDQRPINHWAVAAPFEAALIYYLIIGYQMAIWGNAARSKTGFNKKLTFPSLVLWRIFTPLSLYFWVSLMFSLLFKAFLIPTEAAFGHAGFMVLWMLNWCTLAAVGLALEAMMALLTPEFVPFFLIFLIITNITSSFQPIEVMEKFYQWMRILPFYNAVQGYKIITHATRENHYIGLNFGVLIAFTLVDFVTVTLCVMVERKREEKAMPNKKIIYS